jgi:hypothetical protein
MGRRWMGWVLAAPLALAGCRAAPGSAAQSVPRPAEWTVATVPEADIGAADGDPHDALYEVLGAARLSDGRIAVANAGTGEVRIYDPRGRFLAAFGRKGEGPGEFHVVSWLGRLPGDTLAVWDSGLSRWSRFSPNTGFVTSVTPHPLPPGMFPAARGVFADGSFVLASGWDYAGLLAAKDGIRRDTVTLLHYGRDGTLLDTLARLPGNEEYIRRGGGRQFSTNPVPFGRATFVAIRGSEAFVGDNGAFQVDALSPSGRLLRRLRRDVDAARVTSEDVARDRRERLARIEMESFRRQQEEVLAEVPIPRTMPAFAELRADDGGRLWVGEYPRSAEEPRTWNVFAADGRQVATVRTPAGLEVLEVGDAYVLGKWTDEDGAEHVRLYRVNRNRAH